MKAREIMSANVLTVSRDTTIDEIARLLTDNNISGVPVVNGGRVVGMVTQKDLLYKDIEPRLPGVFPFLGGIIFIRGDHYNEELKKVAATKAEQIMTRDVFTVDEDTEVEKVAELMVDKGINRVPVLSKGSLVGIITRADVVRYTAERMR